MQTRSALDVRTVVVVVSLVALVALAVWSIGLWLTSTQSLQNQMDDLIAQKNSLQTQVDDLIAEKNSLQTQVTGLQNQIASVNMQLAEKQSEIENLELLVTVYRKDYAKLLERLYPPVQGGSPHGVLIR